MTGFGSGRAKLEGREISIEIKTLNHRYLDLNIRLPRDIAFIEEDVRKIIQEQLSRGRVDVYVDYVNAGESLYEIEPNRPLLNLYMEVFNRLEQEMNIENDITMNSLLNIPDMFLLHQDLEDEELIASLVSDAMNEAISSLKHMRSIEGEKLKKDILERAHYMRDMVRQIEVQAPSVVEEYRQKLEARLEEILPPESDFDQNRFSTEVAYFAERSNITEEIIRLYSHIDQLEEILNIGGCIGRKLDFLIQEMNREVNTIGSKSSDIQITNLVVDLKSEIEKIREQIQNIE